MHTKKQIIVAIGREHGSGGHYIAQMISRALGVRLYDKKSIEAEVVDQGYSPEIISQMDELPCQLLHLPPPRKVFQLPGGQWQSAPSKCSRQRLLRGRALWCWACCGEQVLKKQPQLHQHFHLRQPPVQAGPNHGEAESGYGAGH